MDIGYSRKFPPQLCIPYFALQKCVGLDQNVQVFLLWSLLLFCNGIVDIFDGFYKLIVICFIFLK